MTHKNVCKRLEGKALAKKYVTRDAPHRNRLTGCSGKKCVFSQFTATPPYDDPKKTEIMEII